MKKILYGIKAKCHEIGFTDRTDMQNDDNCSYTRKKNKNDNLQAEKKTEYNTALFISHFL